MSSSQGRPLSPGDRRIIAPARTSAGSVFPPSYYDVQTSRPTREFLPLTRTSVERTDAPRVLPVRPRSPPRRTRDDDFAVRPRRMSLDPGEVGARRPTSTIIARPPNRAARPIVTKEADRPASPLTKSSKPGGVQLEASYIIPGSSSSGRHHHRHSSLTTGEKLRAIDKDIRERGYPGSSTSSGTRQPAPKPPGDKEGRDYTYEYTGPRKEFERDPAPLPRPRERRESYGTGRERPTSMIVGDRGEAEYRRTIREAGPPVSTRGFDNIGRSESVRQAPRHKNEDLDRRDPQPHGYVREERDSARYKDVNRQPHRNPEREYIPYPEENPRHTRQRKSTLEDERVDTRPKPVRPDEERFDPRPRELDHGLERSGDDRTRRPRERDGYGQDDRRREYDGRDDRDRRTRDEPRDQRDKSDDGHSKSSFPGTGAVAAGAAAAGLVAEGVRRHRPRDGRDDDLQAKEPTKYLREPDRDRTDGSETTSISGDGRPGGAELEEREERRRRRHRDREREEREYREAKEYDRRIQEDDALLHPANASGPLQVNRDQNVLREQKSYERRPSGSAEQRPRRHGHHRRHYHHTNDNSSYSEPSSASGVSSDTGDDVTRQPRVVTPSNEDKPALPPPPPKGILKKARTHFPEESNPIREGVAPLDAAKRGIPPEARWTRINRRLVNPEALEAEGVRFEEGPDFVIVLKVLNHEDINRYAQKTHEIREKRRLMLGAPPPGPTSGQGGGGGVGGAGGEISDQS